MLLCSPFLACLPRVLATVTYLWSRISSSTSRCSVHSCSLCVVFDSAVATTMKHRGIRCPRCSKLIFCFENSRLPARQLVPNDVSNALHFILIFAFLFFIFISLMRRFWTYGQLAMVFLSNFALIVSKVRSTTVSFSVSSLSFSTKRCGSRVSICSHARAVSEIMDDNTSKSRPACDERCRQPHAESVEGFRWAGASLQYSGHFSPSISPPYARLARPADPYLQGVAAEICAKLVDGSRASASLINVFGVEKSEIDAERRRIASQSDAFCAAPSLSSSFAVRAADEHAALQRAIDALGAWERPAGAWEMDAALPLLHALSQRANAFVVRARRRLVALAGPAAVAQVAAVESAVAPAAQSADQGASAATSASLAAVPTSVQRAIGCALARWPASAQPVNLRPLASIVNWVALIVVIAAVLFVSR